MSLNDLLMFILQAGYIFYASSYKLNILSWNMKNYSAEIEFLLNWNLLFYNKANSILDIRHLVNVSPDWLCLMYWSISSFFPMKCVLTVRKPSTENVLKFSHSILTFKMIWLDLNLNPDNVHWEKVWNILSMTNGFVF